jgi:hypothetical protein
MAKERYSIEMIHEIMRQTHLRVGRSPAGPLHVLPNGNIFALNKRMKTFLRKGTDCVSCGAIGQFYMEKANPDLAKCTHRPSVILSLYAQLPDANSSNLRVMTRDHIFPRSHGGSNGLNNMQPMCNVCNGVKGSQVPDNLDTYHLYSFKKMIQEAESRYGASDYWGWITYWGYRWYRTVPSHKRHAGGLVSLETLDELRYELWMSNRISTNPDVAKVVMLKSDPLQVEDRRSPAPNDSGALVL